MYHKTNKVDYVDKLQHVGLDAYDYCQTACTNRIKIRFLVGDMIFGTLSECLKERHKLGLDENSIFMIVNGQVMEL